MLVFQRSHEFMYLVSRVFVFWMILYSCLKCTAAYHIYKPKIVFQKPKIVFQKPKILFQKPKILLQSLRFY